MNFSNKKYFSFSILSGVALFNSSEINADDVIEYSGQEYRIIDIANNPRKLVWSGDGSTLVINNLSQDKSTPLNALTVDITSNTKRDELPGSNAFVMSSSNDGKVLSGASGIFNDISPGLATIWKKNAGEYEKAVISNEKDESLLYSTALAISGEGLVVGGILTKKDGSQQAVIWSGENFNKVTYPAAPQFQGENFKTKGVLSLSSEGNVAGGISIDAENNDHATVWSGPEWTDSFVIDGKGSSVSKVSPDGKVLGGYISDDQGMVPAIWYGENWSDKVIPGQMNTSEKQHGVILALSSDGRVAAGSSLANGNSNATVWYGEKWQEKLLLETPNPDLQSEVESLSLDGSIAAGVAETLDGSHAMIWKLQWTKPPEKNEETHPSPEQQSPSLGQNNESKAYGDVDSNQQKTEELAKISKEEPHSKTLKKVLMVDATNTVRTVESLGQDIIHAVQLQREGLLRLQQSCFPETGKTCWLLNSGYRAGDGSREAATGFSVAMSLTPEFDAGIAINKSTLRGLPDSFHKSKDGLGVGVSFRWHKSWNNSEWYLTPSFSYSFFDSKVIRKKLNHTEAGEGDAKFRNSSFSLIAGQNYSLNPETIIGWFTGVRRLDLGMKGWDETNAEFGLTWNNVNNIRTEALAGLSLSTKVGKKISWINNAEISHSISDTGYKVSSHNPVLGNFSDSHSTNKTLWRASSGLAYHYNEKLTLSVTPAVWKSMSGAEIYGVTVGASGSF